MSDPAALRPGPAYLYFNGAERTQFGYGATVSVVPFIISFVFALAYQRYALRRDTAGAVTRAVGEVT